MVTCSVHRTMPRFEFVEFPTRNEIDRRRQRVAVRVRPNTGGASLFLGDVWCSTATSRWHFTTAPGNLRRGDTSTGYRTREAAAWALLDARMAEAEAHLREAVAETSALRRAAGEDPVAVITTVGP